MGEAEMSTKRLSKGRITAAALLGVVALPFVVVAITGRWATGTLLDTTAVSKKADQILAEPAVVSAMGDFLGEELMSLYEENVDITSSLPPGLQEQGKVIEEALKAELTDKATTLVGSGAVQDTLSRLVTGFHSQMVGVLDDSATSMGSGVTLNLVPVATELMKGLQESGLLPEKFTIPEIDQNLPPKEQVAALSKALEVELPDEMGSVEVFSAEEVATRSDDLENARQAVSTIKTVAWATLAGSLVLFLGIYFVSGSRRAAAVVIGAVLFASGLAGAIFSSRVPDLVADGIDDVLAKEAVRVSINDLGSGLRTTNVVIFIVGLVVVAAGIWGQTLVGAVRSRKTQALPGA